MKSKKKKASVSLLQSRTNSVPSQSAHNDVLCGRVDVLDRAVSGLTLHIDAIRSLDFECFLLARMLFLYGCRVSELLQVTGNDVDRRGMVLVKGKKGSDTRKVIDTENVGWWLSKRFCMSNKVFTFNRFYVYRMFIRVGICDQLNRDVYRAVTHLPRFVFVAESQEQTGDIEQTAEIVGHKSSSSSQVYVDRMNKKAVIRNKK